LSGSSGSAASPSAAGSAIGGPSAGQGSLIASSQRLVILPPPGGLGDGDAHEQKYEYGECWPCPSPNRPEYRRDASAGNYVGGDSQNRRSESSQNRKCNSWPSPVPTLVHSTSIHRSRPV
jgi:hypothetical protein